MGEDEKRLIVVVMVDGGWWRRQGGRRYHPGASLLLLLLSHVGQIEHDFVDPLRRNGDDPGALAVFVEVRNVGAAGIGCAGAEEDGAHQPAPCDTPHCFSCTWRGG